MEEVWPKTSFQNPFGNRIQLVGVHMVYFNSSESSDAQFSWNKMECLVYSNIWIIIWYWPVQTWPSRNIVFGARSNGRLCIHTVWYWTPYCKLQPLIDCKSRDNVRLWPSRHSHTRINKTINPNCLNSPDISE